MIAIVIRQKRFELTPHQLNHMKILDLEQTKQLLQHTQGQLVVDDLSPECFTEMLRLLALAEQIGYDFPDYPPIRTKDLTTVLPPEIAKELTTKTANELNDLFKVAHYFICDGVRKVVVAAMACRLYFHPTLTDFNAKRAELGVKKDLTEQSRASLIKAKSMHYQGVEQAVQQSVSK